jgi:hypothetical protein
VLLDSPSLGLRSSSLFSLYRLIYSACLPCQSHRNTFGGWIHSGVNAQQTSILALLLLLVAPLLSLNASMDPHNEWSMSKELAAQACDQCYRCKLRCSRTQPACHRCQGNGSACTWSMGKWLGKPKGTKRKLSGEKEHAEWTHGQQECRSPEKETAASACRSESRDDLYISEAGNTAPSSRFDLAF